MKPPLRFDDLAALTAGMRADGGGTRVDAALVAAGLRPYQLKKVRGRLTEVPLLGDAASLETGLPRWHELCLETPIHFKGHASSVRALRCVPAAAAAAAAAAAGGAVAPWQLARHVVSASADGSLRVWHVETKGKVVARVGARDGAAKSGGKMLCVDVIPHLSLAATGDASGVVRVWDLVGESCLHQFEGHVKSVSGIVALPQALPDGRIGFVSAGGDGTVRVLLCTVTLHANLAHSLTRSP